MKARNWHIWLSIVLMIPMFIVGITAVFIAHDHELGTGDVVLSQSWAPMAGYKHELPEVRDFLLGSIHGDLAATKYGVFSLGESTALLRGLPARDFRQLTQDDQNNLWAAGKYGLWLYSTEGQATQIRDGDFHAMEWLSEQQALLIFEKKSGLWLVTEQGQNWTREQPYQIAMQQISKEDKPYTLQKLMMDLHTGKAFFGKKWEWIWIDVLGVALALLCITGGIMWWRNRKTAH